MENINDSYLKNKKKQIKKLSKNTNKNYEELFAIYQELLHNYYKIKFTKNYYNSFKFEKIEIVINKKY